MNRSVPKSSNAQRTSFPTKNIGDRVYGGGSVGCALAFAFSNGQLVEINLLNFDPVFSESDELQEWRAVLLAVRVGSTDPGFDVFGSGRPR